MQVVLLAGGRGTRALPLTEDRPKALLTVAGLPLIEHVMRGFAEQGYRRFVIALGHRGEAIEAHFSDHPADWEITFDRAGDDADTGDRLVHAASAIDGTFLATYADGLADVALARLVEHHRALRRRATLTAVRLRSQYGTVHLSEGDRVTAFEEKPTLPDVWINGGFFVFAPGALDEPAGPSLERDVLPDLAARQELGAYRHDGFWRSVDTFKDLEELEALARKGDARWIGSPTVASS